MESLVLSIIEHLGGISNIEKVENCITRLRISVHSLEKTDLKKIERLKGVLHIFLGNTVQIVVGPGESKKISDIINKKYLSNIDKTSIISEKVELIETEIIEMTRKKEEQEKSKKKYKPIFLITAIFILIAMIKKIFR